MKKITGMSRRKSNPILPAIEKNSLLSGAYADHVLVIGNESLFDVGILSLLENLPNTRVTHVQSHSVAAIIRAVEYHRVGLVILVWESWMDLDFILGNLMSGWIDLKKRLVIVSQEISQIVVFQRSNPVVGFTARYISMGKAEDFIHAIQTKDGDFSNHAE